MATAFDEIRKLVRAVLLDTDSLNFMYKDETIDQHILLNVMVENSPAVQVNSAENPASEFTADLITKDKALLTYRVARSIVSPNPDYFSYKSPILSVTRSGGVVQLLSQIQRQLDRLQGGFLALQEDNELWALVNGPDRWMKDWSDLPMQGQAT